MSTAARPVLPTHHGLKRQAVAERLLESVFKGEFAPQARLRVEHLAEQLGVSVTPVREALVELAGIGIVELQPNRGAVLRPFGPEQLREICHLRRILESEATRSACGRIAPHELRRLATELRRLVAAPRSPQWSAETRLYDTQVHELITAHCGSERLAHEIGRYKVLFRALRDIRHQRRQSRADFQQMEENSEHLAIVEALLADRRDEAADAMARHIQSAAEALQRDLFSPARRTASPR
jgi:DNA-binding GntR family transcriptional regulator